MILINAHAKFINGYMQAPFEDNYFIIGNHLEQNVKYNNISNFVLPPFSYISTPTVKPSMTMSHSTSNETPKASPKQTQHQHPSFWKDLESGWKKMMSNIKTKMDAVWGKITMPWTKVVIILAVVSVLLCLIVLLVIIFKAICHRRQNEQSDSDILVMVVDPVHQAGLTNVESVENPLWTSSNASGQPDPFANDFITDNNSGFFDISESDLNHDEEEEPTTEFVT